MANYQTTMSVPLERATPESQGVPSAAIAALVHGANTRGYNLHSLMVLRHGKVVAEGWWAPYKPDVPHMMFSVSKSVTAMAIGMLVSEGRADLDEEMLGVFPNLATDAAKANARGLLVRHVLAMATGHAIDTMEIMRALPNEDWVSIFFGVPIEYPPGTHFLYNSGASYVLAAMVMARTGLSVRDYLQTRLFQPLGIAQSPWESNPRGINFGASGLRLTTEDLAKLGQLHIDWGVWAGKRVMSEEWVAQASAVQVSNGSDPEDDSQQGYGFQLWRSRHGSFRLSGRYGQFAVVMPEQDMVVAMTAGVKNNRVVPGLIWETLLPVLHADPLPEDLVAQNELGTLLSTQAVPVSTYLAVDPPFVATLAGRRIVLSFNLIGASEMTLSFTQDSIDMTVRRRDGGIETLPAGRRKWFSGSTRMWPYEEMQQVALESRAGWLDATTLEFRQQCVETPFARNWRLEFDGADDVTVSVGLDNGFWVERTEVVAGKLS